MATPIDRARDTLGKAKAKLPKKGVLADWTLTLRKYPDTASNDDLNMDPTLPARGTPVTLDVTAPDVKPVSVQLVSLSGGFLKAGDLAVKLPRTAALEAFLGKAPYADLGRVEWVLNDGTYQAVRVNLGLLSAVFTLRKLA